MDAKASGDLINFPYIARITWTRVPKWNEMCVWAIEHFGLPGNRFITHATEDYMEWMFSNIEDQLFFILAWGNDK